MVGVRTAPDHETGGRTRAWLIPAGLYLLALVVRLAVASQVPMPATEPSAYYADTARNVVAGQGLVSDAVWSYATEPLVVPKPAFELWQPMSSLISSIGMFVLGPTWGAAQGASAVFGALVAPLAWAVGRGATRGAALDRRRGRAVAITAGLLAAVLAPFVLGAAVPDSYTPFLVFTLLAVLLVPPTLGIRDGDPAAPAAPPRWQASALVGVALGGAWLSRQEAIWLGLTVLLMLGMALRARPTGRRSREALQRLWPIVVGGTVVVLPWLGRNFLVFGSPLPGQAIENMFLVRNEDIFAFATRPNADTYLAQGLQTILTNPVWGAWASLVDVLLLMAFPVGLIGLLSVAAMWRSAALRRPTALLALLVSGGLTFAATALLFPVATRWGTFLHASGPLVIGLAVTAALGADQLMVRISAWRRWPSPNVIIGPVALLLTSAAVGLLQWNAMAVRTQAMETRYGELGAAIGAEAQRQGVAVPGALISDHPMWLADALDRSAIVLPDEDVDSVTALARLFDAPWVVVVDGRGRYPGSLLEADVRGCLAADPLPLESGDDPALLFQLADGCPSR